MSVCWFFIFSPLSISFEFLLLSALNFGHVRHKLPENSHLRESLPKPYGLTAIKFSECASRRDDHFFFFFFLLCCSSPASFVLNNKTIQIPTVWWNPRFDGTNRRNALILDSVDRIVSYKKVMLFHVELMPQE